MCCTEELFQRALNKVFCIYYPLCTYLYNDYLADIHFVIECYLRLSMTVFQIIKIQIVSTMFTMRKTRGLIKENDYF